MVNKFFQFKDAYAIIKGEVTGLKERYNKFICYILALLVLFSGMCLENIKTDSSFAFKTVKSNDSYVKNLDTEFINNESCSVEMLGVRNVSRLVRNIRRVTYRTDVRSFSCLVCADILAQNISNYYAVVEQVDLPALFGKAAILNFIHNKDGKK